MRGHADAVLHGVPLGDGRVSNSTDKREAFEAYQKSNITDEQLLLLVKSVSDMLETMEAMGESGYYINGYHMMLSSLMQMQYWRKQK